jgi:MFS family permease
LLFAAGLGQTIGGILGGVIYDNSDSFYWLFLSCVIVTAIAIIFDEFFFPEFVYFVFPRSKESVSTSL